MIGALKFFKLFSFCLLISPVFSQSQERLLPEITNLSNALKFETVSYSEATNKDLIPFGEFINWIAETYPRIKTNLRLDIINNYSLVYTWMGNDSTLLPGLLTAHYDVVPADETMHKWAKAPFSGEIDNEFVWGRGALDDKSQVIAILEALEYLLGFNSRPDRTLYFAFGHDEEKGGENGAAYINDFFAKQNIQFEFVLDEGGAMLNNALPDLKRTVAFIGIAEKGYLNLELKAEENGGHSSVPPRENAIDILVKALSRINENPMPARLDAITIETLKTLAPYLSLKMRLAIKHHRTFKKQILKKLEAIQATNALVRSIITPTILQGGVSKNALPQIALANINVRLLAPDSVASVVGHLRRVMNDDRIDISLKQPYYDGIHVTSTHSMIWRLMDSTIKAVFPDVIVAPFLFPASTDSRHYVERSTSILRFNPILIDDSNKNCIHGVDERIAIGQFLRSIQFYKTLLKRL